jgi:hypothetical protein
MRNADMPAMPSDDVYANSGDLIARGGIGLTKREAFAMAAMQGLLASGNVIGVTELVWASKEAADAVLAALEVQK